VVDLGTDDMMSKRNRNTFTQWFTHSIDPNHIWLSSWEQYDAFWISIARANDVLAYVPAIEMDEAEKSAILGEARAMRALAYLHLVKAWGDMPKVISVGGPETYNLPRSSVVEIYDEIIIPDLIFAETYCVDNIHTGRVTKWSAKMFLADVYLTRSGWRRTSQGEFVQGNQENWALARDKAQDIIVNSPHSLITEDYVDGLHTTAACLVPWVESKPYSVESMMELGAINISGLGSFITRDCHPDPFGDRYWGSRANQPFKSEGNLKRVRDMRWPGRPPPTGVYIPSPDLGSHFEAGDERKDAYLLTRYDTPEGDTYICQPTMRKYVDIDYLLGKENTTFLNTNRNILLYRYADALLIYAESQNEVNEGPDLSAYEAINEIRNRAGLLDLTEGLSKDDFRKAVWKERRSELCGEMKRRFDLIRTNRLYTETLDIKTEWTAAEGSLTTYKNAHAEYGAFVWPDHEWLFPIPTNQMILNKDNNWSQNNGYSD